MKWKLVVGLILVAGLLAVGAIGVHTHAQAMSTNSGFSTYDEGPHPSAPGAWCISGVGFSTYDEGPHPSAPGAW